MSFKIFTHSASRLTHSTTIEEDGELPTQVPQDTLIWLALQASIEARHEGLSSGSRRPTLP